MSHPAWAGLRQFHGNGYAGAIKIGETSKAPVKRGMQICSSSGLIGPATIEWMIWVNDRKLVEREAHGRLQAFRITKRRELFCVPVGQARSVIEDIADGYNGRGITPARFDRFRRLGQLVFWLAGIALVTLGLAYIGK